jgi:prepilin-type N-terminal cleavage/methylation domain-containing protein/prepilin-type processing-associated H-X9-DG protein
MRLAFSLIELLVVLAIVAVLAAMLIPAVSSIRTTTYTVTCASNQRQIVMGVMAYAGDWNDVLPYSQIDAGCVPAWLGTGTKGWSDPERVGGYIDAGRKLSAGTFSSNSARAGVWYCRADRRRNGFNYTTNAVSYGLNRNVSPAITTTVAAAELMMVGQLTSLSQVGRSDFLLTIDTQEQRWLASNFPGPTTPPTLEYSSQDLPTAFTGTSVQAPYTQFGRHRNAANAAFADGHVQLLQTLCTDVLDKRLFVRIGDIP